MAWPTYGKLKLAGFGKKPESPVLRTEFENGPPKESLIKARSMVQRSVTYMFTLAEFNTWETWFSSDAKGGKWFDWIDPFTGSTLSVRIVRSDYDARVSDAGQGSEPNVEVSMIFEHWSV